MALSINGLAYDTTFPPMTERVENSHITYARTLERFIRPGERWLDVGCGHSLVPEWIQDQPTSLLGRAVGLDRDQRALGAHAGLRHKTCGDVHRLPFADRTFDVVTANMVVEHVEEPVGFFREVRRVLRPGGRLLIHTPNALGYTTRLARAVPERLKPLLAVVLQRRATEDVYPAFYRANTQAALGDIARQSGLALTTCDFVMTSPQLGGVPGAALIERRWLQRLSSEQHASDRPVLVATFSRD
jgi:SAM-dependent methyltransferase